MRFLQPEPRTAPKDIFSKSWTVSIERYLRIVAEYILIATNNAHSNQFDLACAIYYPKAINKKLLQNISVFAALFGTCCRALARRKTSAIELCTSEFLRLRGLWSNLQWTLVYDGPGAAARHDAAGLHFSLPDCPCPRAF